MAKKNEETYTDVAHEQDSRRMMEHINNRSAEQDAVEENRSQNYIEEIKKMRTVAMSRYVFKSVATLLLAFALYKAMTAELIAPVLVIPATYLCAIYFGWCCCKVTAFAKKVRGIK